MCHNAKMLPTMDHTRPVPTCKGQILIATRKNATKHGPYPASANLQPQDEMLLNVDHAHPGVSLQEANLNLPQEEMLLNMDPRGGARAIRANILGFRVFTFDRQCGGVMWR